MTLPQPIIEVRLLRALGTCEEMAQIGTVEARSALGLACDLHAVDRADLAVLWVEKIIACTRARAALTGMEVDDVER